MTVTTDNLFAALRTRHDQPRNGKSRAWVYAEEVRVGTGWRNMVDRDQVPLAVLIGREQRIDAFALHTWPSERYRRVAYEVKASRSDLQRELEQPHKCEAALALSNEFYLVIPSGLRINDLTLPDDWGVIRCSSDQSSRVVRRAPWRDTALPPYSFMLSLARNLCQALDQIET